MNLKKSKQNLRVDGNNVFSYNTHVATISDETQTVTANGYWSKTTQRHINYVARELSYKVTREDKPSTLNK